MCFTAPGSSKGRFDFLAIKGHGHFDKAGNLVDSSASNMFI